MTPVTQQEQETVATKDQLEVEHQALITASISEAVKLTRGRFNPAVAGLMFTVLLNAGGWLVAFGRYQETVKQQQDAISLQQVSATQQAQATAELARALADLKPIIAVLKDRSDRTESERNRGRIQ